MLVPCPYKTGEGQRLQEKPVEDKGFREPRRELEEGGPAAAPPGPHPYQKVARLDEERVPCVRPEPFPPVQEPVQPRGPLEVVPGVAAPAPRLKAPPPK